MGNRGNWTFITNHGAVLSHVRQENCITVRKIASDLEITERSVHRILKDLLDEGYVTKTKNGRHNCYEVNMQLSLRHVSHRETLIGDLLEALEQKR